MASLIKERALSRMRTAYEDGMMDTCVRQARTEVSGDYGYGQATYADVAGSLECLYRPASAREKNFWATAGGGQVLDIEGVVYFKRSDTVLNTDRLRITHMHGDTTTERTYEIVAGPVLDQVVQKVAIKLMKDGTD